MKDSMGWRRYSTNTLILAGLVLLAMILVAAAAAGAFSVSRVNSVSSRLVDILSQARVESQRLFTAMLDQETAVRGYALAGGEEFLTPYRESIAAEQDRFHQLRQMLSGEPAALSAVDSLEAAAQRWRSSAAELIIASVSAGQIPPEAVIVAGKQQFDSVRADFATLDAHLTNERTRARHDLTVALRWQNSTLSVVLLLFAISAVLLALLVRRGIGMPLARVAADTRAVAAGDFGRPIIIDGPSDVRRLGRDIDSMRQRIVSELDVSVSQAARLEQANADLVRSNSELEQFAYVASHDLQEPLRKVASFSQLLERRYGDVLDDRGKQYIAFAVDGAERMQILINDLLAFSRVGRVYDNASTVDLNETLASARKNLSHRIEQTDAIVSAPALPTVSGEPTLLTMLYQNLVGNALKFAREGERPHVEITVSRDDDMWEFAVRDNGIGIDPEFAEKIFIIFQRLHARGDNYGGTGIGLAMCRKIVEYHGGRIWLDTTHAGPGSTFRFTLPAMPEEADVSEEAGEPEEADKPEKPDEPDSTDSSEETSA